MRKKQRWVDYRTRSNYESSPEIIDFIKHNGTPEEKHFGVLMTSDEIAIKQAKHDLNQKQKDSILEKKYGVRQ